MKTKALLLPFIDLAAQRLRLGDSLDQAMQRVVEHGQYIMGPEVESFEKAMEEFCGARNVITCANGTDALILVMMAHGIGPGDAVFVPAFTFVATAEAVSVRGATPVCVDVDPVSFNIDPVSLARAITAVKDGHLKARMIVAVDLFGRPADYPSLREIADHHGLLLIADAAQAFGAKLNGQSVGTLADCTTISFFPAKPLGCFGDGGAIATDDDALAALLRSLRLHGRGGTKYDSVRLGLNSRLDTLQAAILIEKLRVFGEEIDARNDVARRYDGLLSGIVQTPKIDEDMTSVWAQYTVTLAPGCDRAKIQAACRANGIPTMVYYPIPMHLQAAYAACPRDPNGLPQAEMLAQRVLSLPMHPYLDVGTQQRVGDALSVALGS